MSRFLKIERQLDSDPTFGTRWINVHQIDEIYDAEPRQAVDAGGNFIYVDGDQNKHVMVPRVAIVWHYGGAYHQVSEKFLVDGSAEEVLKKVTDAIAADLASGHPKAPEPEPDPNDTPTRWRDTWKPGETYVQLDVVAHPDDVRRRFIAMQGSMSTSVLVLSNTAFWCELKAAA